YLQRTGEKLADRKDEPARQSAPVTPAQNPRLPELETWARHFLPGFSFQDTRETIRHLAFASDVCDHVLKIVFATQSTDDEHRDPRSDEFVRTLMSELGELGPFVVESTHKWTRIDHELNPTSP